MAKRHHRLLSALLAGLLVSSSAAVTANAATVGTAESGAGSLAKYYSTNGSGIGKEKTITIDGDASDWDESMIVAQGAAWDVANHWKGGHENCVLDTYALFAAWDDSNLYIGWQMVNTTDTWARSGDGPLSDGGRVLDVPLIIALNTGKGDAMTGKTTDGKGIWGADISFQTRVDTLLYMSGKPGLGTPGFFKAADSSGVVNYTDKNSCKTFTETGVEYKLATTNVCSSIWGLNSSESPSDVGDNSADWVDYKTFTGSSGKHDTQFDSFYEAKIPFSALGISKDQLTSNGIGAMVIASRGESGLDCVPFDLCMLDNATGDYSSDPSTSAEKDDADIITVSLASVGNGTITPPASDDDTSTQEPDTSSVIDTTSETVTDTPSTDTSTDTPVVGGTIETPVVTSVNAGESVKVTLGIKDAKNVLGMSNTLEYDSGSLKFVSAKALHSGVQVNTTPAGGAVKWNAQFGDGTKGETFTSETPLVEMTFKSTSSSGVSGKLFTNKCTDIYDYDFNSLSDVSVTGSASADTGDDTDVVVGDLTMYSRATSAKGGKVNITFTADLSAVEGFTETMTYDTTKVKYDGYDAIDGVQVNVDEAAGVIKFNYLGLDAGGADTEVVTFKFTALEDLNDTQVAKTVTDECFDSSHEEVTPTSVIECEVEAEGGTLPAEARKIPVTAKKGDIVRVTFKATSANAAGIQEIVDFSKSALSYNNDAATSLGILNSDASSGRVAWNILFDLDSTGKGKDLTSAPEIAVMTFTALRDIASSDDVLSFTVKEFYDANDNDFDLITTTSAEASVVATGEGKVPVIAKKGNYVKAYCKAIDAPKALGIVEDLVYDASALKYLGKSDEVGHFSMEQADGAIRWSSMFDATGTDLTDHTDLVVFTFYAQKDITSADNVLSYTVSEFYDFDFNDFDTSNKTMVFAVTLADAPVEDDTDTEPGDATDTESESDVPTDTEEPTDTDSQTDTTDSEGTETESDKPSDTDTSSDNTDTDKGTKVLILFGDVDDDKAVNSQDAVLVLRSSAGLEEFEEIQNIAADVNDDETVDSADSLSVLRYSVSLFDDSRTGKTAEITIRFK